MTFKTKTINISPNIILISGEESRKFLQAIISADIATLKVGTSQTSLLLNPAGKTIYAFYVYSLNSDEFLLISEQNRVVSLKDSLARFLIRTKATIEDVTDKYSAKIADQTLEDSIIIDENLFGQIGLMLSLSPKNQNVEVSDEHHYTNLRISNGAVSVFKDLGDNSIAQEAGLEEKSVSFNKGCFLGQELVCRIDSRSASTPFTYFALCVDKKELEGLEVFSGNQAIGSVTSSLLSDVDMGDFEKYMGRYTAIGRFTRKGSELLKQSKDNVYVLDPSGEKVPVVQIDKVNGNFRV